MIRTVGKELIIVLARIVTGIEKVLQIIKAYRIDRILLLRCRTSCNSIFCPPYVVSVVKLLQKRETVDAINKFFAVRIFFERPIEVSDNKIGIAFFIIGDIKVEAVIPVQ